MSQAEPSDFSVVGAGDVVLRADAWGDESSPSVVLLHGGGQTRHSWAGTARDLARAGWHAVAFDLRGHGESDWAPDGDYRLDTFASDVRAIARSLPSPPAVVGASMGGIAALVAAGEDPAADCSALVLVDIAPQMDPAGVARIVAFMQAAPDGFGSLEEAAAAIAAYLPDRRRQADPSGLTKNLRLHPDGRWRWHWDPAFINGQLRPVGSTDGRRLHRAAAALELPTLLVRGRLSDLITEEAAHDFLETAPHAEYVDVEGAGHMVAGDRNDVFTAAVVEFLQRAGSPSRP